jgi:hypothetical protein
MLLRSVVVSSDSPYFDSFMTPWDTKCVLMDKCVEGKRGVGVKVLSSSVSDQRDVLQALSTELLGDGSAAVPEEDMGGALLSATVDGGLPILLYTRTGGRTGCPAGGGVY